MKQSYASRLEWVGESNSQYRREQSETDLLVVLSARVALEYVGPTLRSRSPDRRRRPPLGPNHEPALVAEVQTPVADLTVVREAALQRETTSQRANSYPICNLPVFL